MSLTATPSPGTFTSPQLVTLTDPASDSIFYTVDGSAPSYTGSYRDWDDGLLTNQTGVSSNSGATFTNPGTWLRQTHSAASTSAVSFLDFVPQSQDFTASFRFRFNSASCSNDTSAALVYRCTGKYAANDTYGYVASVWRYGVGLGRGSNKSTGAYTSVASAAIASPLAYDTWHTLTVTVSGSRHRISVNGVELVGADDNTFVLSGYVGLRSWSPSGTAVVDFDSFLLESLGGTTQRYTAPIPVVPGTVAATTIKAVSVTAGAAGTVQSYAYTLPVRAQAPTATVSGTSPNAVVTLASATPGATLYYTTDGSTPKVTVSAPATPAVGATGKFTDARDGKVYKTVYMPDGKWWSAENLVWNDASYTTVVSGRYFYRPSDYAVIAPTGSHVPTSAEFNALVAAIGSSAGAKLRTTTGWPSHDGVLVPGTDDYGFGLTPTGYINGGSQYEWDYGGHLGAQSSVGGDVESYGTGSKTDGIGLVTSGYSTTTVRAIRFIVDSGNVPDTVTTVSGTQYTASFPYLLGQPVTAIARAAGYLDSLPVRLYPVDTVSGIVIGTGYLSTNNTVPYSGYRALWLRSIPYGQNTQVVTELTPWLTSTTYRFYGTILETPAPPTTGTASTKQPVWFPDQGIQISLFPRQPTIYDNRVDWGNGPVTNRSLKMTWRVPQNDQFLFASTKTAVSKLAAFGDLDVVTQSDTWSIGGANATAQLAAPVGAHYLDVNASLGFVSGIATTSQATRVTGGRNSAPMAIWLSPGAGNARLNIPIHCVIQLTDADLDNINYVVSDGSVTVVSGAALSGQIVFDYVPTFTGPLQLTITLTDPFNFQTVVNAPSLTVLNNQFPVATFTAPVSGTAVFIGEKTSIQVDLSDAESEIVTWQLLNNHSQLAYGTTSPDTSLSYKFTVTAGPSQIGIVVADPLGAAPEQLGPMIYGAACKATGITTAGTLQSLNPITLTPTTVGAVDHVVWDMYPSTGHVSLQSATAPFAVVWTPAAFPTDQDVVVTATAYDAAGYGVSFSKTLRIAKADITGTVNGTVNGTEASDIANIVGSANLVVVTVAATEAKDVVAITGGGIEPIHIAVAATDAIDVASVTGSQLPPVTGTLYGIEEVDSGHCAGAIALKVTGSVTGTEATDSARVIASNARPVLGNVQATDPVDYALFLSPPPPGPGWNPEIEFIEIADVVDIGIATRIIASAFSPYADVTEFVVEYQRITTPDPETDPSPWLLLQYVTPTR